MKKVLAAVVSLSMILSVPAFADTTTTTTQTPATEVTTTQTPVTEATTTTTTPATTTGTEATTTPATTTGTEATTTPVIQTTTTSTTTATPTQDAGITPDSALYALDKLMEKIQLALVTDAVKEAGVLANIAQERLAESNAMADKANIELTQKALEEYKANLEKAVTLIETAMEDGKEVAEVMEGINDANLKDAAVVAKILTSIPEEFRAEVVAGIDQLIKATAATTETAQVVENKEEENGLKQDISMKIIEEQVKDAALIAKITDAGLNTRQVIALISLSEQSKKPLGEVIDLFLGNEKGIGTTAHELGLSTKDALKGINDSFKSTKATIKLAFKEAMKAVEVEDQEEVATIINNNLDGQTVAPTTTTTTTAEEVKAVTQKLEKVVKEAKEQVKAIVSEKQEEKAIDKAQKEIEKVEKAAEKAIEKVEKAAEKSADMDKVTEVDNDNDDEDKDNDKDNEKENEGKSNKKN